FDARHRDSGPERTASRAEPQLHERDLFDRLPREETLDLPAAQPDSFGEDGQTAPAAEELRQALADQKDPQPQTSHADVESVRQDETGPSREVRIEIRVVPLHCSLETRDRNGMVLRNDQAFGRFLLLSLYWECPC